ncbi:dienelactone hydrolase family protein [Paenibacillus sp. JX-17]|uniref:Dienelactone hydrolase family protein n=1 Tax=Paenibacillus lacisoli TaxID=3064525 RepID=A0ABT9C8E6_9BACL|nr:dienelactone hydrolase family protein [Paenibacillus sp. JX-17]MDO7905537.1 dienelactone hydrolase family protein [Paenibacillus sp. JX-17]
MSDSLQTDPLLKLLGDLPNGGSIHSEKLNEEEQEGYRLETWLLDLNGIQSVPASIAVPLHVKPPYPIVIFNHSHGGNYNMGRREFTESSSYLQQPSFARTLTGMGYAACCIDMWGFNERSGKTESELVKEMLWQGRVLWGMMLYDSRRLLDYLETREEFDMNRTATIGMSMGGLMAWWLAALDERIKVTVDLCGQVDAHTLLQKRGLDHHGFYSYVPGLLKFFTTLDIQKRIVPRPRMSLNGTQDRLCPPEGIQLLDEGLSRAYAEAGVKDHWHAVSGGGGHMETAEMRKRWKVFLAKHL